MKPSGTCNSVQRERDGSFFQKNPRWMRHRQRIGMRRGTTIPQRGPRHAFPSLYTSSKPPPVNVFDALIILSFVEDLSVREILNVFLDFSRSAFQLRCTCAMLECL